MVTESLVGELFLLVMPVACDIILFFPRKGIAEKTVTVDIVSLLLPGDYIKSHA